MPPLLLALLLLALPLVSAHAAHILDGMPATGKAAPDFRLKDAAGRPRALSELRGRPSVLCFLCGCSWCQNFARAWGEIQHGGALGDARTGPRTLIVFSGDAAAARAFAEETRLDKTLTILMPDPQMQVTQRYNAEPCPRLLVLDGEGIVRYANVHEDDAPRSASPWLLVARLVDALRTPPPSAAPAKEAALPIDAARPPLSDLPVLHHDCGLIDPLKTSVLVHTFVLRNSGAKPLGISRLQPSCGCSTAIAQGANAQGKVQVAVGQDLPIKVTVEVTHLKPGSFQKIVSVYGEKGSEPIARLEIAGELRKLISFTPPVPDFGRELWGKPRTIPLTARIDARLLHTPQPPHLYCSYPDATVIPEAGGSNTANSEGYVTRRYRLVLSPQARVGQILGRLYFTSGAPAPSAEAVDRVATADITAYIVGDVTGRIVLYPQVIAFGVVSQGHSSARQIVLAAPTPDLLTGAKFTCSQPWLTVHPAAGETGGSTRLTVEATVNGKAPRGALAAEVTIIAHDGERLVLPVYVTVN